MSSFCPFTPETCIPRRLPCTTKMPLWTLIIPIKLKNQKISQQGLINPQRFDQRCICFTPSENLLSHSDKVALPFASLHSHIINYQHEVTDCPERGGLKVHLLQLLFQAFGKDDYRKFVNGLCRPRSLKLYTNYLAIGNVPSHPLPFGKEKGMKF